MYVNIGECQREKKEYNKSILYTGNGWKLIGQLKKWKKIQKLWMKPIYKKKLIFFAIFWEKNYFFEKLILLIFQMKNKLKNLNFSNQ